MDLNALQQKINNYTTVISSWFRNVGKLYFSGTPENVTVQMLDEGGNLVNTTLPNVAQFRQTVWDAMDGAIGQFNKKIYVDSDNGDDTNSGASSSKFKTLKKAIDSIPVGGYGAIYLHGTSAHKVDEYIDVVNKTLRIDGVDDNTTILFTSFITDGVYNYLNKFHCQGTANFIYRNVTLKIDEKYEPSVPWAHATAHFGNLSAEVSLFITTNAALELSGENTSMIGSYGGYGGTYTLYAQDTTFIDNGGHIMKLRETNTGKIGLYSNCTYDVDHLVSGMIKDTNGVPRNILSNIIL